jgi:hypothetical protein
MPRREQTAPSIRGRESPNRPKPSNSWALLLLFFPALLFGQPNRQIRQQSQHLAAANLGPHPRPLGDEVLAVFNKTASKAIRDRVAAAMKLDTFNIEGMTTDATVMHLDRWRQSLDRRARILPIAQRILSLPEKEADIWNVSMTLAKDAYPDLDVGHYNREFERVVERIRQATPPDADPERRIRTINTILYLKTGIAYDPDEREGKQAVYNRYPFSILDRKRGNCFNLALFYIAIAQRLGYPVYPVSAPEHLFARYVTPGFKLQNIDPSGRGRYSPDEEYIRRLEIPAYAVKNGTYLRTMSYRELAAYMVADHGGFYYGEYLKDYVLAIALMERGLAQSEKNSEYWCLLGIQYKHWGLQEWMPEVRELKFIRSLVFIEKGKRMGLGKTIYQELRERKERKDQEERKKILARPEV